MDNSIIIAATNGNVELLNWYEKNGYKSKIEFVALQNAYNNGHYKVLEWIKKSIYPLRKYKKNNLRWYSPLKIILIFIKKICIKKVIKWLDIDIKGLDIHLNDVDINEFKVKEVKGIKFKTKNNYIKGYNKN
jgi:hypothetical protein